MRIPRNHVRAPRREVECPLCPGTAVLTEEDMPIDYRGMTYTVRRHFYLCDNCGEEFTEELTDTLTQLDLHHQYRELNPEGPPTPSEKHFATTQ